MSAEFFGSLHSKYGWLGAFEMSLLCSIYANQTPLLEKLCENVIKQNRSDFKASFTRYSANVNQTLGAIKMRCGLHVIDAKDLGEDLNPCNSLDIQGLTRLIELSVDLTSNLLCFVSSIPSVAEFLFYDANDLPRNLCEFLEVVLKCLFWSVRAMDDNEASLVLSLKLKTSASNLVEVFRIILEDYILKNIECVVVETALPFLNDVIEMYWARQLFDVDPLIKRALQEFMNWAEKGNPNFLKEVHDLTSKLESESPADVFESCPSGSANGADNLQRALNEVKQLIPEVDDKVVKYYLLASNLSVEESVNLIFENNFSIPEGANFDDFVEPEPPKTLTVFKEKEEELTPSMMKDIVTKYSNVQEGDDLDVQANGFEDDVIQTSSQSNELPDFRHIFVNTESRQLSVEYDDEYDDTYDHGVEVVDSFNNGDVGFSVQNPNWGAAKWTAGISAKRNNWDESDEDEEVENQTSESSNQKASESNTLPQNFHQGQFSSGAYSKRGQGSKGFNSGNQRNKGGFSAHQKNRDENASNETSNSLSENPRTSYPNQPKSAKSHRRTEYQDDWGQPTENKNENQSVKCENPPRTSVSNHPRSFRIHQQNSSGDGRNGSMTSRGKNDQFSNDRFSNERRPYSDAGGSKYYNTSSGARPKEFKQQPASDRPGQSKGVGHFGKGTAFDDNNDRQSHRDKPSNVDTNAQKQNDGTAESSRGSGLDQKEEPRKPMGRGRGYVNKYKNDDVEHKTKTANPHNRKAASAKKTNYNVPNFQ